MAHQSKLDVSKWQADRPHWNYTPVMQFYVRFIQVALIDANCDLAIFPESRGVLQAMPAPGSKPTDRPTDAALLARDWIATSKKQGSGIGDQGSVKEPKRRFVSFPECCEQLGVDPDAQRVALLNAIDEAGDFDNDETWVRLEEISATEPPDDDEPLFEAWRIVPALDQMNLFAA
jgi:hypothetical protein